MNILAIECSTPHASLCLAGECGVLSEAEWVAVRNHDAHLFPALEKAMQAAVPELIVVGAGPGSYGGVRVALAAATGVGLVCGARVVAICSWDQLAEGGAYVLSDAKRGGWALRHPDDGRIDVMDTAEVQRLLHEGATIWSVESAATLARAGLALPRTDLTPTARGLVDTWRSLTPEQQAAHASRAPEPIYVRPPHITAPKHKPWEVPTN